MNNPKQHTLWLLVAVSAPIAHFSGTGWLTAALTAVLVLPLTFLPRNWSLPKPLAMLQILWLGIVAGFLLPVSAVYWPSNNTIVVPLTILILVALTDSDAVPRIGAVLALCMALLAIPITISAASRIEPEWLPPTIQPWHQGLVLVLLLAALPAAGKEQQGRRTVGIGSLTILLSTIVQGTIGNICVEDPFYQTARTLGHMEPIAAAAVTLGWYAMTCFLFQSAREIAKLCKISRKWASVLLLGTSTFLVLIPQQPNTWFVTVISLFLWVITPFVTQIKHFEKTEK